jgi:pyridoxamine 5'-phosphate oxidase
MHDPIARFSESYARASLLETFDVARAALATSDRSGRPSVRFVLVKHWDERGFAFFTNLESRKSRELMDNPRAALSFHWASTGEQIRIEGSVERVSDAEADAYFQSRPRGSQLGAWASPQSQIIAGRRELLARLSEVEQRFVDQPVPRPAFWSGFRLQPERMEFWQDRPDRLHDRELYTRSDAVTGSWQSVLLAP